MSLETVPPFPDDDQNEAALAAIDRAIEGAEEVKPKGAGKLGGEDGIVPLGHADGFYYFISSDGEKRRFTPRELVRLNISSLFGGETFWLCKEFPCYNKNGEPIDDAFSANKVAEYLMRACSAKGLFNVNTPSHHLGVWRSGVDPVAHLGATVWHRGMLHEAGCVIGGAIYPALTKLEQPDFANPADSYDGRRLWQNMNAWSFVDPLDRDLLFGFWGASLYGGFPRWRVHAILTGDRGSGKSTLAEYLIKGLGPQGVEMNDYSEAGVRQHLTNEARTIWLDEGETGGEDMTRRMTQVIGLMRKMSGGAGARIVRGSSGGQALSSTVTGCVLISAINPPPLLPQDRSRILTVPINPPRHVLPQEDIDAFMAEATRLSPRLRARALINANRFSETLALFRRLLVEHGCDARQSDLYATLCAGRSILLDDVMPSAEEAVRFVTRLQHRLRLIMLEDSDASDAQNCLNHLMDHSCEAIRDGIKRSIGMLVGDGMDPVQIPENDKLKPLGLKIVESNKADKFRYLFIANDHIALRKIFHNSAWADGNWRASLVRLPGVRPSPTPISIGRKARGLLIPPELLPDKDMGNKMDLSPPPDPAPPKDQA